MMMCRDEGQAKSASSNLQINATVPVQFQYRLLHQARLLKISEDDAERGHVKVENGTIFRADTNSLSGYSLVIHSQLVNFFQTVTVVIDGRPFILAPGGTVEIQVPYDNHQKREVEQLSYRFQLIPGTLPGDFPWPLTLSVSSHF